MPEMHPKIVFLGGYGGKIWYLNVETPLGNQSAAKQVIWCKNDGGVSLRLFSRAWQEITKLKKNYTVKSWTLHFIPCQGFPAGPIVVSFCMLGGTHNVITRTKF